MARTAAVSCSRAVAARTRLRGTSARTHIETISRHRKTFAALMPLLHQDTRRGGGGTSRHRHSLSEYIVSSFDYLQPETANTPKSNRRANDGEAEREWRWDEPASPELAQTPRALVPNACFPPRQQRAFASYSENARPGSGWSDETNGQGMNGLITSLKGLGMPAPSSALSLSSSSYDGSDKTMVESPWPPEQARWPPEQADNAPQDRPGGPNRRASFCGVMSSRSNGREALRWSGTVPPRCTDPSGGFSAKVFLGGLPWDMSETALMHTLRQFSPVRVEWPGRDGGGGSPRGYAYVTLESECCVRALLCASRRDRNDWYYRMGARKMRTKEVQVIPWAVSDSNWVVGGSVRLEPARTVFVGALHGMLSASALAAIMSDLFSGVVYAGIDTDKHKYPIGSGRVTFNNVSSYVRAISAGHVEIHTDKFTKKVQVDPYLEDSMCSVCNLHQGPYFCREPICFRYYCRSCWSWQHRSDEHRVLVRNSKSALPAAAPAMPDEHAPTNGHAAAYIGHGSGEGDTPSPTDSGASGASPSASTSASEPDSGLEHDLRSLV